MRVIHGMIAAAVLLTAAGCSSRSRSDVSEGSASNELLVVEKVNLTEDSVLQIETSREPKYNVFKLSDPDRIVVDVVDATMDDPDAQKIAGAGAIKEINVQPLSDSLSSLVRLEILTTGPSDYVASFEDGMIQIKLSGGAAPAVAESMDLTPSADMPVAIADPTPAPEAAPLPEMSSNELPPAPTPEPNFEMATPALPMPSPETPPLPELALERSSPAPIEAPAEVAPTPAPLPEPIAPSTSPPPAPVMPIVTEKEESEPVAETPPNSAFPDAQPVKKVLSQEIPTSGITSGTSTLTDIDSKIYTGRRVSLEFQDADIQDVLRLISDVSKLNIVTSADVKGRLTLKLIDVPWDQALDIVLTTLSLDKIQHGNILRVAPAEQLKKEREIALANDKAARQLEPLRLKLLNVNYAKADELSARIKNLLSERGTVDTDARTNTLIVKDIKEHLSRVENLVRALDTQTPQVRIEARIVQANDSFTRSLGIKWGPSLALNTANSKQTSISFPYNIGVGPADFTSSTVPDGTGLLVDASETGKGGGMLGFRLGSVSNIFNLDLQLNYAEVQSLGRVVSRPSIITLDNKAAKIIQGTKIPYLSSGQNGANVSFQDAGIEITVTPQITNDGSVMMQVATKSNEVLGAQTAAGPQIGIREANTEMLLRSGNTGVLGGVFRVSDTRGESGVPLLKDIPVLGWLFKETNRANQREETLIFITPYILNDNREAVTAPSSVSNLEP